MKKRTLTILLIIPFVISLLTFVSIQILDNQVASDILGIQWNYKENEGFQIDPDNGYELEMDLPGFKKDEVEAELKGGYLTISAHKAVSHDEKNTKGRVIHCERTSGACSRSFFVGKDVREDDCTATFEDGVLHVSVPKVSQNTQPARRLINIA